MDLKINNDNYIKYKQVFEIIWKHQSTLYANELVGKFSPIKVLNELEEKNKQMAKRGLKEGLRDSIIHLKDAPEKFRKAIDNELISKNLPGILKLQAMIDSTQKKVLKRKRINTEVEYYTIKDLVDDLTTILSDTERIQLSKYMSEYEIRNSNKR